MNFKKIERLWMALSRGRMNPERAASVFDVLMADNHARQIALNAKLGVA